MSITDAIRDAASSLGIHEFGFMSTADLSFSTQVRELCAKNYCGRYNRCWACPPAVGSFEECRAKIMQYDTAFVFTTLHMLEDSFDYEGMIAGRKRHSEISGHVVPFFRQLVPLKMLVLSGDGCTFCKTCTYPNAPCRFPNRSFPSVESYGLEVNRMAEATGVHYINGKNTVTYFGCIFFNSNGDLK